MAKKIRFKPRVHARLEAPLTLENTNPATSTPMPGVEVGCDVKSPVEFALLIATLISTYCQQESMPLEAMMEVVTNITRETYAANKAYIDLKALRKQ